VKTFKTILTNLASTLLAAVIVTNFSILWKLNERTARIETRLDALSPNKLPLIAGK